MSRRSVIFERPIVRWLGVALLMLAAGLVPTFISSGYLLGLATQCAITALFLIGLNIAVGEAGLVSVAHGGLFSIGAYATAILTVNIGWPYWATIPVAVITASIAGLALGMVTLKLAGQYFVIASLAFSIVVTTVLENWTNLTGGYAGISSIPSVGQSFQSAGALYLLILGIAVGVAILVYWFLHTTTGLRLRSIRENPALSGAVGVDVFRVRLVALALSAGIAGLAGSLDATYLSYISPTIGDYTVGFQALMALVVGGLSSSIGPFVGSLFFVLIPEALRSAQEYSTVVFGASLIVVMLVAPGGIWGELTRLGRYVFGLTNSKSSGVSRTSLTDLVKVRRSSESKSQDGSTYDAESDAETKLPRQ